MADSVVSLLLVNDTSGLEALLREAAAPLEYRVTHVPSLAEAARAARACQCQVLLFAPDVEADAGLDSLRQVTESSPDTQIIVVTEPAGLSAAIHSYEQAAFAYVQKPVDGAQLAATLGRALERRRIALYNRRLFWELQTINEITDGTSRSLELDTVLDGAVHRIVRAFDAATGSIRLRNESTGAYDIRACIGACCRHRRGGSTPCQDRQFSDRVIATRASVIVRDAAAEPAGADPANTLARSAVSVPMLAGNDLVGTVTIGAGTPDRFGSADERLLGIVAGQILVAVQNARLHESVGSAKREWERTFDAIKDPIAVFDGNGMLLRGNTALASALGIPVTALPHSTCSDIGFCGGGCPACAVGLAIRRDEAGSADITRPDGEIFSVTTFPVRGSVGVSVVQVARNVTEKIHSARRLQQMSDEIALANTQLVAALDRLKSTQAQLLQAEKLSAIGQLVSGVAHELNNPLTSVIGYAQLLESEFRDDDGSGERRSGRELAADLRHIADEAARAGRIIRNLLAFARRQATAREPHDIVDLVGRVVSLRSYNLRLSGIELVTEFEPGLPQVVADGGQLQQALLNLILNAEQAMKERRERRLAVGARLDAASGAVEVFVADTGHGIDASNLSRIFDPFFTTREVGEGTGLGLSICYGIIRDHGGEIAVTTRVEAGTTFSLRLPARLGPDRAEHAQVLVAHHEPTEREFVAAALRAWGYKVVFGDRADEGLDRYRTGDLHAAVVGWGLMSTNPGGWSAILSERPRTAPLLLLAVNGADDRFERFRREHSLPMLAPPFQLRALWSALRAIDAQKEYA